MSFYNKFKQDGRCRYYVNPKALVWQSNGGGSLCGVENLLSDDLSVCKIHTGGGDAPAIVLDFGEQYNGGIELHFTNPGPMPEVKTRIRFGESVSEVMGEPNNDHSVHDVTLSLSVMSKHEFGTTGFRFVRLDFLSCQAEVLLASVKLIALERPYEYLGSFESSDELLNRIWRVGARTVQLCCQDYILDGIKRDRLLWVGDLHPQINVIGNVFGNVDIVAQTLDMARVMTPKGGWMNGISTYSLWWIVCVYDWYMYSGDKGWLAGQCAYLDELVGQIGALIDEDGSEHLPSMRFMDWAIGHNPEVLEQGLNAITILAMRKASQIFNVCGQGGGAAKAEKFAKTLEKMHRKQSPVKQVGAMRVLAGLLDAQEANRQILAVNPCEGLSSWFAYYVLEARAMAGDICGSLDMIRRYWGGMLSLGATSFWEHFETSWLENASRIDELPREGKVDVHRSKGAHCFTGLRHSLCHGWAGGPTAWLSRYVLGVRAAAAGFEKAVICPSLGGLEYVKGTVPTPYGLIKVQAHAAKDGRPQVDYELPAGVSMSD